ncbi:MAG: hypothetical protein P8Y70_18210 [Candidatus Lokiarchaeota archaeon]
MLKEKLGNLNTTVVGSFPLDYNNENMERVFRDQVNIGIDFPCYPQLIDMVSQFLDPLSEILDEMEKIKGKFILMDDFEIPINPIAQEYGKYIQNFLSNNPTIKKGILGTKACLTGPITLATEMLLGENLSDGIRPRLFKEPRAIMKVWVVEKIATIMSKIGKAYSKMGFDIVSMDEPILSLLIGRRPLFHDEEFYIKMINKALKGIEGYTSVHVCGSLSPNLRDLLLKTNTDILDHEFQTNKQNFNIFKREHLEETNKILAMGTLDTKVRSRNSKDPRDYVEPIKEIEKLIRKGIELYGPKNLLIKPDCGFRALKGTFGEELAYKISILKLKNMVLAKNNVQKEI